MASLSPPYILPSPSSSLHRRSTSTRLLSLRTCALSPSTARRWSQLRRLSAVRAQTFDFSASFFEGGFDGPEDDDDGLISPSGPGGTALSEEDKPEIPCPPGLRRYETMAVLRPDMTEDERLALTQKYEELLVSGGGMYVEVYNRGVIPLSYSIKKKNKAGETNTYLDGIYILFTYFTKPESMAALDAALKTDDDVIRSSSFKILKEKEAAAKNTIYMDSFRWASDGAPPSLMPKFILSAEQAPRISNVPSPDSILLPVIDMGGGTAVDSLDEAAMAELIARASEEYGFFRIVNHGFQRRFV